MSTLEVDPENRPQTASELPTALAAVPHGRSARSRRVSASWERGHDARSSQRARGDSSGPERPAPASNDPVGQSGARSTGNRRGRLGLVAAVAVLALLLTWLWQRRARRKRFSLQPELPRSTLRRGQCLPRSWTSRARSSRYPSRPRHPAILHLPPGRYSLRLRHPELPEERQVDIEVVANETVRSTVDLELIDLDRYFEDVGLADYLREAGSE